LCAAAWSLVVGADVHSPWRRCTILEGVVGGVGVDDDDACLMSCWAAARREGVERAEGWP
jgi:hypothetical protein